METKNTTVKMLVFKNVGIPGIHKRASMRTGISRLCEGKILEGYHSKRSGCIDASDSESRRIFSGFFEIYEIYTLLHLVV